MQLTFAHHWHTYRLCNSSNPVTRIIIVSHFWATVCKTVRPMLSDRRHVLSVLSACDVGVSWPNGSMDQNETWHRGRPRPRPHCVRWGPSSPTKRGTAPNFPPCLLWPNGWIYQDAISHGRIGLGPGDTVLDGEPASTHQKGTQ